MAALSPTSWEPQLGDRAEAHPSWPGASLTRRRGKAVDLFDAVLDGDPAAAVELDTPGLLTSPPEIEEAPPDHSQQCAVSQPEDHVGQHELNTPSSARQVEDGRARRASVAAATATEVKLKQRKSSSAFPLCHTHGRQQQRQQHHEAQQESAQVNSKVREIMQASLAGGGRTAPKLLNARGYVSSDRTSSTRQAGDEALRLPLEARLSDIELEVADLRKALGEARHHEAEAEQRAEQYAAQAQRRQSEAEQLAEQFDQAQHVVLTFLRHKDQTTDFSGPNDEMSLAELLRTALAASEDRCHSAAEAEAEAAAARAPSPQAAAETTPEPACPAIAVHSVAAIVREVLASGTKLWRLQLAQRALGPRCGELFPHGSTRAECSNMSSKGHHSCSASKPSWHDTMTTGNETKHGRSDGRALVNGHDATAAGVAARTPIVGDDIAEKLLVEMSQALHRLEQQAH